MAGYLQCQAISVLPCLDDWLVHPGWNLLLNYKSVLLPMLELVGFKLNVKKLELERVQDIQLSVSDYD